MTESSIRKVQDEPKKIKKKKKKKKKAAKVLKPNKCYGLFVGINYFNQTTIDGKTAEIKGSDEDIRLMIKLIHEHLNMEFVTLAVGSDNVELLADFELDPPVANLTPDTYEYFLPTNYQLKYYWFHTLRQCHEHNVQAENDKTQPAFVWYHYSGHGFRISDPDDDDGDYDECLVPVDFASNALISDYFLHDILLQFPKAQLIATADCCRSGTLLNLNEEDGYEGRVIYFGGAVGNTVAKDIEDESGIKKGGVFTRELFNLATSTEHDILTMSIQDIEQHINATFEKNAVAQRCEAKVSLKMNTSDHLKKLMYS